MKKKQNPNLKVEIWQRDVSCAISSRSIPASCGCITSFGRFFERNPMLICWNAPRQFVIPHCDSATSWCANLRSHQCVCGENVDQYGDGLSCRRSAGRHSRHSAVNDLIKRALTAAEIPARLDWSHTLFVTIFLCGNCGRGMMASVQMAWHCCHGHTAGAWCGTSRVQTLCP